MSPRKAVLLITVLMFGGIQVTNASATPCDGVDRDLSDAHKAQWASPIAKQLGVAKVDVLQSFAFGGWHIVYVNTYETDEAFLFYAEDPRTSRYLTHFSGAAMADEEFEIRAWEMKSAPGIPARLAECFAWHVTKHRDI